MWREGFKRKYELKANFMEKKRAEPVFSEQRHRHLNTR